MSAVASAAITIVIIVLTLSLVVGLLFCIFCLCCPEVNCCCKIVLKRLRKSQRSSGEEPPQADPPTPNQCPHEPAALSDIAPPRYQDVIEMTQGHEDSSPPPYSN